MEIIKKLLEVIDFSKDQWIGILSCLVLVGTIGGGIHIQTLHSSYEIRIETLKDQIQEYKEKEDRIIQFYIHYIQIQNLEKSDNADKIQTSLNSKASQIEKK